MFVYYNAMYVSPPVRKQHILRLYVMPLLISLSLGTNYLNKVIHICMIRTSSGAYTSTFPVVLLCVFDTKHTQSKKHEHSVFQFV